MVNRLLRRDCKALQLPQLVANCFSHFTKHYEISAFLLV
jgi:hypothetical protein